MAALLPFDKSLLLNSAQRKPLLLIAALWIGFFVSGAYALFAYTEMNHAKTHANHIVQLNNAVQQLRQIVSASMLNQSNQLAPLEKEVQHFRYLLLRTKSNTIDDNWEDIHQTLLDADAFVEDVDNLLASIYSVSSVTKQLKRLIESSENEQLQQQLQAISSYLLFELHGLNDKSDKNRIERFNAYVRELDRQMASLPEGINKTQLFNLYTGLERLNRQLESVDAVTNHKFSRTMTQLQRYWTNRILELLDETLASVSIAGLFLLALVFVHPATLTQMASSVAVKAGSKEEVSKTDNSVVRDPSEPLYAPEVLKEQLENDEEAIDSVLTMFVAEHQADSVKLRKHIDSKEIARARSLVHNLKGVTGNIGAQAMLHYCKELDIKLREGTLLEIDEVVHFEKLLNLTIQAVLRSMEQTPRTAAP